MLAEGPEGAIYRMKSDAYRMGANAVHNVRFMSSMVDVGTVELVAYGTSVIMHEED
ncbi:heavy metal-binding domain-containing protein [Pseudomonadales bacterium]|nr:heavy metal-binding domain-containing protein [Pseudomonadales bacterium]